MTRRGARREARLGPRLPVHRGLHRDRPHRGHDLRREAEQRRRHQHVDRRPAGAQRRQQHPGALYDSLIETYNVQMLLSAGNSGPGMNTIGDPAVATKAMAVGAYITDATYLAGYGADFGAEGEKPPSTSRPAVRARTAGSSREIVAPGAAVSTIPLWQAGCLAPGTAADRLPARERDLDGVAAGGRRRRAAHQRGQATGRQWQPAQIREAYQVVGDSVPGNTRPTSRATGSSTSTTRGTSCRRTSRRSTSVGRRRQHDPERLPRDAGLRRGHLRPRGRPGRRQLRPAVHVHPDQRARWHDELQPDLGRQRWHVQLGRLDRAAEGRRRDARRHRQPDHERRRTRRSSTSTTRRRSGSSTRR